jgi:hypothetical protein
MSIVMRIAVPPNIADTQNARNHPAPSQGLPPPRLTGPW